MELIPAIDIRGGKCVRLYQGDYAQETVYGEDPVAMAAHWVDQGATRLHVVDLDGARDGKRENAELVARIAQRTPIPVQLGGGIRDADAAAELLDIGITRVVFGTAAVDAPDEVQKTVDRFGADSVIVGVDALNGVVATRGWLSNSGLSASSLMQAVQAVGVSRFIYTDISRDGTLEGPNISAITDILNEVQGSVIAAGGISSVADLERLATTGVEAAITGKAIYTGAIEFKTAVRTLQEIA